MQKLRTTAAFALGALLLTGVTVVPRLGSAAANQPVKPPCDALAAAFVFTLFQFTSATTAVGQGLVYMGGEAVGSFDAKEARRVLSGLGIDVEHIS